MHIKIIGLHAPNADLLRARLDAHHTVEALTVFPVEGELHADAVITNELTADEAARLRCALLQVPGAGADKIALNALSPACTVCNVHGHEVPIAEFVTHAVLEHVLQPWRLPARLDQQTWPAAYARRPQHAEAAGQTVAIVGFGHIGQALATRLQALDMAVIAVTRSGRPGALAGVRYAAVDTLHEVLAQTDALVLCCPLDDSTRGLIDRAALARLKPGALLVNVARAQVVDEQALFDALSSGVLGRAVLDVWYRYPTGPGDTQGPSTLPFHTLPNVRATPHVSAMTPGLLQRRYDFMAQNLTRWHAGDALQNVIRQATGRATPP